MNSSKIKSRMIVFTVVLLLVFIFIMLVRAGGVPFAAKEQRFRELLCQIREGTVFQWTEDGIIEVENEQWVTYIVDRSAQMETLDKFSLIYSHDEEHLIISYGANGDFQSYQKLGKGKHTITLSKKTQYLYIAVHNDDVPSLQLKNLQPMSGTKKYAGRYLSVLGDSVSSYEGYLPEGLYPEYDEKSGLAVNDMWWHQLASKLGLGIGVINGSAGSGVVNIGNGSGGNEERCVQLHTKAHDPDLIIVLLGSNDFFARYPEVQVKQEYQEMINRMQERYPKARIILCGYYHPSQASYEVDEINQVIKEVGKESGLEVISLEDCKIEQVDPIEVFYDYDPSIGTGVHPNALGHTLISDYLYEMLTNERGDRG